MIPGTEHISISNGPIMPDDSKHRNRPGQALEAVPIDSVTAQAIYKLTGINPAGAFTAEPNQITLLARAFISRLSTLGQIFQRPWIQKLLETHNPENDWLQSPQEAVGLFNIIHENLSEYPELIEHLTTHREEILKHLNGQSFKEITAVLDRLVQYLDAVDTADHIKGISRQNEHNSNYIYQHPDLETCCQQSSGDNLGDLTDPDLDKLNDRFNPQSKASPDQYEYHTENPDQDAYAPANPHQYVYDPENPDQDAYAPANPDQYVYHTENPDQDRCDPANPNPLPLESRDNLGDLMDPDFQEIALDINTYENGLDPQVDYNYLSVHSPIPNPFATQTESPKSISQEDTDFIEAGLELSQQVETLFITMLITNSFRSEKNQLLFLIMFYLTQIINSLIATRSKHYDFSLMDLESDNEEKQVEVESRLQDVRVASESLKSMKDVSVCTQMKRLSRFVNEVIYVFKQLLWTYDQLANLTCQILEEYQSVLHEVVPEEFLSLEEKTKSKSELKNFVKEFGKALRKRQAELTAVERFSHDPALLYDLLTSEVVPKVPLTLLNMEQKMESYKEKKDSYLYVFYALQKLLLAHKPSDILISVKKEIETRQSRLDPVLTDRVFDDLHILHNYLHKLYELLKYFYGECVSDLDGLGFNGSIVKDFKNRLDEMRKEAQVLLMS
ncbi:hypothetical protein ACFL96_01090 [Thermoproteota archaeon]